MPPPQATTIRRAKAQYRKSGPQIAPGEQRRLARAVELDKRAQAARERDQRRKKAEKARAEREDKEREKRKQLGVGLATQLAGYSLSQKQMKGGMEGWLGVGGGAGKKRKRDEEEDGEVSTAEEKENIFLNDDGENMVVQKEGDSFGSNMSLDDVLLGHLEDTRGEGSVAAIHQTGHDISKTPPAKGEDISAITTIHKVQDLEPRTDDTTRKSQDTPPRKRAKTIDSPDDSWAQFLDGNTQILQEISQSPPRFNEPISASLPPMSTQDLEITSDDWFETGLPKTANPALSPIEGVSVRDFAYFKHNTSGSFTLEVPGAPSLPRKSRTEKSMLRSFGQKPTIASPTPKMTATCAAFTAAECSFTSDYHHYGLSTQLLQQALDDGDDDTEDEDEEVYSQALEASKIPDKVRMPPPPLRLSPKVFKPPAKNDLFSGKGGLQILGLSTQMLNDAVSTADDELTDEDEDDGLFNIPIKRSTDGKVPDTTSNMNIPAEISHLPTPTSIATHKKPGFGDFGLSTQVLQDAALDDIDLTDDEDTQGS